MSSQRKEAEQTESPGTGTGGFPFSPRSGEQRAPTPGSSSDAHLINSALMASLETDFTSSSTDVRRVEGPSSRSSQAVHIREERLPCNFPGLLKVLIPEKSFIPTALAVRVTNLSASGAMIEIHDKTSLDKDLALANRFFELKVAHPEIPILRGTIAWTELNRTNPLVGLSTFEQMEQFSKLILTDESTKGFKGPPALPAPKIDPYPPRTNHPVLTITGLAPEAVEVVAKGDEHRFRAPVHAGKFELQIELDANAENLLSLRAFAGERKSRAVPIRVTCELPGMRLPKSRVFNLTLSTTDDRTNLVELEFCGTVQQAERILYRFSQIMASSEKISLLAALESPGTFDKRLFDALNNEGRMLMAETGKSMEAARLLNELL